MPIQDVTISAEVGTFDASTTGTAYLMNMIGPGTTTANQIATADFTVSSPNSTLIPLFTELDLLPGSYHLVLTGPKNGNAFWRQTFNDAMITTASGVALTDFGFAHTAGAGMVSFGYFPASTFALTPDLDVRFTVMGTPVPKPASWLLFGTVLAFVAFGKRRVRPIVAARTQWRGQEKTTNAQIKPWFRDTSEYKKPFTTREVRSPIRRTRSP